MPAIGTPSKLIIVKTDCCPHLQCMRMCFILAMASDGVFHIWNIAFDENPQADIGWNILSGVIKSFCRIIPNVLPHICLKCTPKPLWHTRVSEFVQENQVNRSRCTSYKLEWLTWIWPPVPPLSFR